MSKETNETFALDNIKLQLECAHNSNMDSHRGFVILYKALEELEQLREFKNKFNELPQRTIETLEVGDVIITRLKGNEWTQISMQEQSQINHFITFSHCYDMDTIIPHEALELLKEVVGNE